MAVHTNIAAGNAAIPSSGHVGGRVTVNAVIPSARISAGLAARRVPVSLRETYHRPCRDCCRGGLYRCFAAPAVGVAPVRTLMFRDCPRALT